MSALHNLDWEFILQRLASYATSEAGRQRLLELTACPSPAAAEQSCSQIVEVQAVLEAGQRGHMESLDLFNIWHQRLAKEAVLKTLELKDVRHFCMETIALKEILAPFHSPWIQEMREKIMEATAPLSAIDQLMTPEGDIRTDASEMLYKLYHERSQQTKSLQNTLDRLAKQHDLEPVLQERYVTNREGRWVLPVKSGMQHHFEGIIHSSSQTKQTVFMEPKEIIPLNNRLRQIEVEIEQEVERLLEETSRYLWALVADFSSTRQILLELDVRLSQGQLAVHLQAEPCSFAKDQLTLLDLRHPLLALSNPQVVSNSVELDANRRLLLLSGPNAGGKTVLLKAVGLAAQMARCGLPICAAPSSRLPFFKNLHVAVGDAQSVDAELSTFAAHLKILNESSLAEGSDTLLLIDEICGSTDPEEGVALARSFIECFAQQHVFGVITSHLSPLKLGWSANSGVVNGSLEYDQSTGRPTYQFLMGVPGQSLAIQTAKRVGVRGEIIERALSHLSPEMRRYQTALSEVEDIKTQLRLLREDMDKQIRETKKEKEKYTKLSQKFEREKEEMLKQTVRRAEKKIDQIIEHTKVDEVFKRHEKLQSTKFDLPEIIKASPSAANAPRLESAQDFTRAFPPGSKVFAVALGHDAIIQGVPNSRGEVPVLANSMLLTIHWQQLKTPQHGSNPTRQVIRQVTSSAASPLESDRQVDLRGLKLDDAIGKLEAELDTASLHHEDRVKIIHGHGTEALKRGVRSYLSRSVYVKKWVAGQSESGGDGITWVELKD